MSHDLDEFLTAAEQAARAGGAELRRWLGRFAVREKGPADLVTEADLASQSVIRALVLGRFPSHEFVGEEGGESPTALAHAGGGLVPASAPQAEGVYRWIVDPLDGTTNYVRGVPH